MTQQRTARATRKLQKTVREMFLVRLEADGDDLVTHDLYRDTETSELARRAAMVEQLRVRVRAGTYHPNLRLVAERMLHER